MLGAKAVSVHAQLLDVFRCVERLSDTDPSSFRRLVQRDSLIAAVPRTDSLPAFKVDTRELLRRLPLHVMACVLAQEPRENGKHSRDSAICCTRAGLLWAACHRLFAGSRAQSQIWALDHESRP